MDHPRRLSTDIDIIVEPGTDLEKYIEQASLIFPFKAVEEQIRVGKNNIEKRHFKFTYDSPINDRQFYILLDVLFEHNNYSELIHKTIQNDLLITEPDYLPVCMPSANCILADKLTAFAPHTTGIPLNIGKDMEVIKQFYDVSTLLNVFTDFKKIRPTYEKISKAEVAYRGIDCTSTECLWDTFNATLCIAGRGKVNDEEYSLYLRGIRELRDHIYFENYTPESAAERAPEIMYMVLCLLTDTEFIHVENSSDFINEKLENERLLVLLYLRKVKPEAYAYVVKTDRLLTKILQ